MVVLYVPLAIAFVGTTIAALWDLKTTEVPDQLPYAMIAFALLFYSYQSITESNIWPVLNSLIYGLSFLAFGGLMYYLGQWGGADALILASMGFLLSAIPRFTFLPFSISYLINLFIVGTLYMIVYAFFFALINKKIFSKFFQELKSSANILMVSVIGLFALFYVAGLTIDKILYGTVDLVKAFFTSFYPLLLVSGLYLVWKFSKSVENHGFRKKIPVNQLKVGDMLAFERKLKGITEEELKKIKKSKKKYIEIKEGVRFAPAFVLALVTTVFYGDLIFLIIKLI